MNDRYLFRGKRVDNGEWAQGYYHAIDGEKLSHYIFDHTLATVHIMRVTNTIYEVDPSTVGQCTGLRDKNGTLIFEGDILHPEDWDPAPVVWKFSGWMLNYTDNYEPIDDIPDALIVGNIPDNPELMDETDVMRE